MPIPADLDQFIGAVADAMVADILESFTAEEITRLVEEMEAKLH